MNLVQIVPITLSNTNLNNMNVLFFDVCSVHIDFVHVSAPLSFNSHCQKESLRWKLTSRSRLLDSVTRIVTNHAQVTMKCVILTTRIVWCRSFQTFEFTSQWLGVTDVTEISLRHKEWTSVCLQDLNCFLPSQFLQESNHNENVRSDSWKNKQKEFSVLLRTEQRWSCHQMKRYVHGD